MARKCYEVAVLGDGTGVTAWSSGNPRRPDLPAGTVFAVVGGNPARVVVAYTGGEPAITSTWSGTEAVAAARWGVAAGAIARLQAKT